MKKNLIPFLRVIAVTGGVALILEILYGTGESTAFAKYPQIPKLLIFLFFILVFMEVIIKAVKNVTQGLKARNVDTQVEGSWWKRFYASMLNQVPVEREEEILLEHEHDGIRELDNTLPTWWVGLFYATIIFMAIYLVRYEILGADNQVKELEKEMAMAKIEVAEYKKNNPNLLNADNVQVLTGASDLEAGKKIFQTNCVACHAADGGGGIGPNLVDKHWILGGTINKIFNTISEGGRDGKGMVAWKSTLEPEAIAQVASYIISLKGTTPANPKAPEGDIIVE